MKTQGSATPLRSARDDRSSLLIRCDANIRIGTGHVMRCLALAQAWQDAGGRVLFAMAESTESIAQRIVGEKMEFVELNHDAGSREDSERTIELARQHAAQWVVVDGYVFRAEYHDRLYGAGLNLLVVDDDGRAEQYSVDIVLNQNPHPTERLYLRRRPSTRLLLGPEYVLLRREFVAWRDWERRIHAPARKLLVTFGGSDPDNVTAGVINALIAAPEYEVQIVVGGSNPHMARLREAYGKSSGHLRLVYGPGDMAELMAWADVAISAAGTAVWEMAFMGLPALLVVLAENQEPIANAVVESGAALSLGPANRLDPKGIRNRLRGLTASHEALQKMSISGRALVDGRGAERVVTALLEQDRVMRPDRPAASAAVRERT